MKTHFSPDFIKFFKELARNNNTEWFHENRERYETVVKKPFAAFVEEVIMQVQKLDKSVQIKPGDAIMRINRDIRFSKDKSPYNIHVSAIVSRYGKKSKEYPGLYLQINPEKILVYSGAYMVEKSVLMRIRKSMANDPAGFSKIIGATAFKKTFGSVQGEKNKIIPSDLKGAAGKQPLIYNKNFYIFTELPAKEITSDKLVKLILDRYKIAKPFNDFLEKSFKK